MMLDLEYEDYVKAHKKLMEEHGYLDGKDIVDGATMICGKTRMSFPDAMALLAQIGALFIEQEEKGKSIWRK